MKEDAVEDEPKVIASGPDAKKPGFFKTKKGKGLLLVLGAIVVFGAGVGATFLIMNMNNSSQETVASEGSKSEKKKKSKKKATKKESAETTSTAETVKPIDLSKPINGVAGATYANATEVSNSGSNGGWTVAVGGDKASATLTGDGKKLADYVFDWVGPGKTWSVAGFSGKIKDAIIGEFGQTLAPPLPALFVMDDGTVEYAPILKTLSGPQGEVIDLALDDKDNFKVAGKVSGATGVVKLYVADLEMRTGGGRTTLAAKADGSFYDLGPLLGL